MKNNLTISLTAQFSLVLLLTLSTNSFAQRGGPPGPPPSAQEAAAFDMTGYWVSVVTEDWRWRMVVAPVGDLGSVPLNSVGTELANAWSPAADDIESCLAFGGAGIVRYPGRLHISWENEGTLRIDYSAGNQTRLLHFNEDSDAGSMNTSIQGYTTANWYKERQTRGLGFGGPVRSFEGGNLQTLTTNLLSAYLQRNGVPYSAEASVRDFYKVIDAPGDKWLIVTSVVSDPVYLTQDWITSTNFKYEPNGDNWNPTACR